MLIQSINLFGSKICHFNRHRKHFTSTLLQVALGSLDVMVMKHKTRDQRLEITMLHIRCNINAFFSLIQFINDCGEGSLLGFPPGICALFSHVGCQGNQAQPGRLQTWSRTG